MAKKTDIKAVQLMRPKARFETSRAAMKSIAEKTGLSGSDLRADHTDKAWRWRLRDGGGGGNGMSRTSGGAKKSRSGGGSESDARANPSTPQKPKTPSAPRTPDTKSGRLLVMVSPDSKRITRIHETRLISEARDIVAGVSGKNPSVIVCKVVETYVAKD